MARSDPMADASLPDMRARSRPGTAIAAMMPMIATTISSSMRVKPLELRIFIFIFSLLQKELNDHVPSGLIGRRYHPLEQPRCQVLWGWRLSSKSFVLCLLRHRIQLRAVGISRQTDNYWPRS